ncbi:kinase-like domain-containing protein [Aspergillus floccosus]
MDLEQCAPRAGNSDKTHASLPRSKQRPETGSIGILFNGQSTHSTSDPELAKSTFCKLFPPDEKYRLQMRRELGNSFLAVDVNCSGRLVAVKEYKWRNSEDNLRLLKTSHTNIVNLLDAFLVEDVFHFVYELMEVSLKELASSVKLEENHISFVCKEILHGLQYIHRVLNVSYSGRIDCENIFLDRQGAVKIADIGPQLLEGDPSMEQYDVRSVGFIMKETMEPENTEFNLSLSNPGIWSDALRDFLQKTQWSCTCLLLQHVFLSYATSRVFMAAAVFMARDLVLHDYE